MRLSQIRAINNWLYYVCIFPLFPWQNLVEFIKVYKGLKLDISEYFVINQHDSSPTSSAINSFITKLWYFLCVKILFPVA